MRLWLAILCLALAGPAHAGPAEAVAAALADARGLPPETAQQTRYLWQPGGLTETDHAVLSLQANLLSRTSRLRPPRPVGPEVLAVAIDAYGWDARVWEKLLDVPEPYLSLVVEEEVIRQVWWPGGVWDRDGKYYPAGHYSQTKKVRTTRAIDFPGARELQFRTGSLVPVVRADWWFTLTCKQLTPRNREAGVGYYDWIGVKNRADFFNLVGFDAKKSQDFGRLLQELVERSGVAEYPRFVVEHQALGGSIFHTLDEDTLSPDNLPAERLKPGTFVHKAERWFAVGSNGLPKVLLSDAAGKLQPSAPDFIGPDDSPLRTGRDGRIHPMLGCMSCHFNREGDLGMRPVDGWVRKTFRTSVEASIVDRKEALEFEQVYLGNLNKRLIEVRRTYREALEELLPDWTWHRMAAAYVGLHTHYRGDVTVRQLAVEIGMKPEDLLGRLRERSRVQGGVPLSLAALLKDGGTVRRETVEDFMGVLLVNVAGVK